MSAFPRQAQQTVSRWIRIPVERPLVTPIILGVLVLIYLPAIFAPSFYNRMLDLGAMEKIPVIDGEWWRLITATLLHGPLIHIALNGYSLYAIGMELEGLIGRGRFAAVYVVSGLAGSVASFVFSPANTTSVGASGAIFGLVGALAVYFGLHRSLFGRMGTVQFWNIVVVILINVGIGFSGVFPIDNSAHLGGLSAGIAVGFVLCPRYRLGRWYNPVVREIENTNTGNLPWVATLLIGLVVVFSFYAALLLFREDILKLTYSFLQ